MKKSRWPIRTKHIYDRSAQRQAAKGDAILQRVQAHVMRGNTAVDPAGIWVDKITSACWTLLEEARWRVSHAEKAAHAREKAVQAAEEVAYQMGFLHWGVVNRWVA